jgi:predicted transcriptional regulator
MRTTIEITDAQRARLVELAALRGEKGFSALVREAIELYLDQEARRSDRVVAASAIRGTLSKRDADALEGRCRQLRGQWR